jgi:uncharacterized membrane protein
MTLILLFQLSFVAFYLITFLIYICKRKIELSKLLKINKDDKEKFIYYREILKNYSIGELGYLFNGKKKTDLLIIAELESLKLNKNISIDKDKIDIIVDDNLHETEKYILEHYKFINDEQFKQNYLKCIKKSLSDKGCITNYTLKPDSKISICFLIFIFSFLIGWYLALLALNNSTNDSFFFITEAIIFLIVWIIGYVSSKILNFDEESIIIKTDTGKNIYLKLNGLKNYIKDFGNFDDKTLEEIGVWEDYILYAIILDESKTLSKQAKEELNNLINIIYGENYRKENLHVHN